MSRCCLTSLYFLIYRDMFFSDSRNPCLCNRHHLNYPYSVTSLNFALPFSAK